LCARSVGQQADGVQDVVDDDGLEDVELEVALRTGETNRGVVADHLGADHGQASHWVGLTLPGMIEEPGSFSGS
jgi:hypothetical protein